jgi:hypothetical protein
MCPRELPFEPVDTCSALWTTLSGFLTRLSAAVSLFRKRPSGRVGLSGVMGFSVEC